MKLITKSHTLFSVMALAAAMNGAAQTPPPTAPPAQGAPAQSAPAQEKPKAKPGDPKPYADVITKDAKSQSGVFKVHRIENKIYWEIPANKLGRELLWQTEIAELPPLGPFQYPGTAVGVNVIRFTRRENRIYMRVVLNSLRAAEGGGIEKGVAMNSLEPIISDFAVEAEGGDKDAKTAVIEVTNLFLTDPADFSVRGAVSAAGVNPNRSYIEQVTAFPKNIETRSVLTLNAQPNRVLSGATSAVTIKVHYSLVELPEKPMMPRFKDSRIGYFTVGFTEFGRPDGMSKPVEYVNRFRLEKKDPSAAVSEPKEPIVFYLAREVPERWRPWLKKGVEDWQVAFEGAGFKNAIICKDAPTEAEDPNWHPEDARYSVIRWAPSTIANAMGPSIQDPRSGETVSAHIIFWNDIISLLEEWYFVQCAAIDSRAQKLPFPEELMGELVRYVSAHEVGHTLGLEHNFKSSSWYSAAQLRDPQFTKQNGLSASIMDYSRFNYVAQPGDGVTNTIGKIGPYDMFAIKYGYEPISYANSAQDEKMTLDRWLGMQVSDPLLRFGNYRWPQDSSVQTEDIGSDAVEASALGFKNLDRIGDTILLNATTKFGEDYEKLGRYVDALTNQRLTELFHVIENVGGVIETDNHAGRGGEVFRPVSADKQRRAVQFLTTTGLQTPKVLMNPAIMNKVTPDGAVSRATVISSLVVGQLLNEGRVRRMFDNEAMNADAFRVEAMVRMIRSGIFSELSQPSPKIDVFRRSVQRNYLDTVERRVNGASASKTDLKVLLKHDLRTLAGLVDAAKSRSTDKMTKLHLEQVRTDISKILNDTYTKPGGSSGGSSQFLFFEIALERALKAGHHDGCFSPLARFPKVIRDAYQSRQ
jgi:hypothetical protein